MAAATIGPSGAAAESAENTITCSIGLPHSSSITDMARDPGYFYTSGIFKNAYSDFTRGWVGDNFFLGRRSRSLDEEPSMDESGDQEENVSFFVLHCCPFIRRRSIKADDDLNESASSKRHKGNNNAAGLYSVTTRDIESWRSCFENIMNSKQGREHFGRFLRSEFSEENIQFWIACQELESLSDQQQIQEKAIKIYDEYISTVSPKEVSIDSRIRDITNRNMLHPTTTTFKEAQNQIYQLMQRDSYHRFLNSPLFRELERSAAKNS